MPRPTQLRKEALGEEHSVVKQSLDLLAIVYAEHGKSEYSGSCLISRMEAPDLIAATCFSESLRHFESSDSPPASILKSPKLAQESSSKADSSRRVHFDEASLTEAAREGADNAHGGGVRRRMLHQRGGGTVGGSALLRHTGLSAATEELISRSFLVLLFLLCSAALLLLVTYAYCSTAQQVAAPPGPPLCRHISTFLQQLVTTLQMNYLQWSRSAT